MSTEQEEKGNFLKTIDELMKMSFFIPSYQRGYRWTVSQVEDLLNDIDNFAPQQIKGADPSDTTWYCLQPVVVRKCNEATRKEHELPDETYEVIDGQQRLTTFNLIIHYANENWRGARKYQKCKIKYETRPEIEGFIDKLTTAQKDNQESYNVDYLHILRAYRAIDDWVSKRDEGPGHGFDENKFQSKFKEDSKVIWYELARMIHPLQRFLFALILAKYR